ncbi:hypothetical protein BDV26DRAFT_135495 [Aspergillus bertholletiae]|uniref:Clr5 domain-containing protein n=1 Tax=Aspergillus bertholletiae TaxID=1226010 RepID=A0A5N7BFR9_9EURO|nr:hypothetical protein BDV26DRAFT_135495 [Aspergillus bertholletiae]
MKHTISFRMWEMKRDLIIKLYQEEEWPLKQVLKRIRSDTFNPSETQLRSRLKKWGVTKLSRRRSHNKFIMSHQDTSTHKSCFTSSSGNGDDMIYSTTTSRSTTKEDFNAPERADIMPDSQPAREMIPHNSLHSSPSVVSAMSPSWEYHDVPPGYYPRFLHPTIDYYNPATSSQWHPAMNYSMLPDNATHDSVARFYTAAPSGFFMHQPAQATPFLQPEWIHPPGCHLAYQPS